MKFKKTTGLLLALTLSLSALAPLGTNIPAFADDPVTPSGGATGASSVVTFDRENAELHMPEMYEQYLPLEKPTSFALSKKGEIAVADGVNLYYYDPTAEEPCYKHYEHNNNSSEISKVQFSERGDLFFSAGLSFYRADTSGEKIEEHILDNLPCTSFLFADGNLFVVRQENGSFIATVSCLPEVELYEPGFNGYNNDKIKLIASFDTSKPVYISYYLEEHLLYVAEQYNVHIYNLTEEDVTVRHAFIDSTANALNLNSVEIHDGKFYYTESGTGEQGGLYTSDCNGNEKRLDKPEQCAMEYTSLTSCNGKLYCIYGKTIRRLNVSEDGVEFSGYEIANNSDSPYRLSNPYKVPDSDPEKMIYPETVRTKEIVAITDTDNKRISLYNRLDNSYTTINCLDENGEPFIPEHIAINKEEVTVKANDDVVTSNKIAVSNGNKIYEYNYERHSLYPEENGVRNTPAIYATDNEANKITGLTFVYGECYYITGNNGYGSTSTNSEFSFSVLGKAPTAIASDVYGTIYVAFNDREFCTFTEEDFSDNFADSSNLKPLSTDTPLSLTVDFEGNVWYLDKEGNLYCNDKVAAQIDGNNFVYSGETNAYPVSFALCFEDDEIYFNFNNYVVKTDAYALESLPSLNKITAGEAKEKTFDLADLNKLFVQVPEGSVGFEINLYALKTGDSELTRDGKYFPYVSYFRSTGVKDGDETIARRGVLLYEPPQDEDGYYVVALYNVNVHSFTANLFKKSKDYIQEYEENYFTEASDTAYISSSVSFCSAPSLFMAPDGERLSPLSVSDYPLERGSVVNVLGFAEGEDREYAFVEVVSRESIVRKGFVPRSYLTKNNPLGITEQKYKLGYLRGDAGIILKGENGEELEITEKTEARLYKNEDGTYTAVVEKDGVLYSNVVLSGQISRGETDALRISLIVILSVLALVIIGGYAFLMFPKKKKK